jgi:hypothetical protein
MIGMVEKDMISMWTIQMIVLTTITLIYTLFPWIRLRISVCLAEVEGKE